MSYAILQFNLQTNTEKQLVQKQFHTKIAGKFIAKKQQELTLH